MRSAKHFIRCRTCGKEKTRNSFYTEQIGEKVYLRQPCKHCRIWQKTHRKGLGQRNAPPITLEDRSAVYAARWGNEKYEIPGWAGIEAESDSPDGIRSDGPSRDMGHTGATTRLGG
jgi:hypothetical protein